MSEQNKRLVRDLIEEVWSRGNFGVVERFVAEDYLGHSALSETRGTEGYIRFFTELRGAFPNLQVEVEDQIAEDEKVVARWTARGTHTGAFSGSPPTGKKGAITGTSTFRIAGGKVAECWTNSDDLGLLQLVGAASVVQRV